jgi:hypothetical protein
MSKLYKQFLTTDANLTCLLAFMRYKFKLLSDPTGTQFAFVDPGDIEEAVKDYENGVQVADAKGLLEMKDTFAVVPTPGAISAAPGKEFFTYFPVEAAALLSRGYTLLRTETRTNADGSKVMFFFNDDGDAVNVAKKISFQIRDAIRSAS